MSNPSGGVVNAAARARSRWPGCRGFVLVGTTIAAFTAAPSAAHAICLPSQQTLPIVDDGFDPVGNAPHVTAIAVQIDELCRATLSAAVSNRPYGPTDTEFTNFYIDTDGDPATGHSDPGFDIRGAEWVAGLLRGPYFDFASLSSEVTGAEAPDPLITGDYALTFPLASLGTFGATAHWNIKAVAVGAGDHGRDPAPRSGMLPLTLTLQAPPPPPPPQPSSTPAPTPTPTPVPRNANTPPAVTAAKVKGGVRGFLKSGLTLTVTCPAACTLSASGTISAKDARRVHLKVSKDAKTVKVAAASGRLSDAGTVTLHLRATAKAAARLKKAKQLALAVAVGGTDAAGVRTQATTAVTIR
jgi:hypothetical protein